MTESFVTQCPHCQTRFRVTAAQLGIAGGAVRCGACLLVFNAAKQLAAARGNESSQDIMPKARPQQAAAGQPAEKPAAPAQQFGSKPASAKPARPASLSASSDYRPPLQSFRPDGGTFRPEASQQKDQGKAQPRQQAEKKQPAARREPEQDWGDVELDLDQLNAALASMDDDRPQPVKPPQPKKPAASKPAAAAKPQQPRPASDPQTSKAAIAADTARANAAILAAAEATAATASSEQPADTSPQAASSAASEETVQQPADPVADSEAAASSSAEDAPAADDTAAEPAPTQAASTEANAESQDPVQEQPRADEAQAEPEAAESGLHAASRDDDDILPAVSLHASKHEPEPEAEQDFNPIRSSLVNLDAEPLQLEWPEKRSNGLLRGILWLLLCLLPLGGLAGQYIWFNYEHLARNPQWRPWFEQACPLVGCELPSRVDVSQIRSSNLSVRNHPTQPGALKIDAIIYNRADFPQPFPLIELRFEDMNDLLLAQRRFRPAEYLGGELAGSKEMPPQTPIHIALEVVDPGAQASNYGLAFHSPEE